MPCGVADADLVVGPDVLQPAEERVAMAGEADVARFAGERRAGDVADGELQRARVAAGADDDRDAEPRDLDAANHLARSRDEAAAVPRPSSRAGRSGALARIASSSRFSYAW